MAGVGIIFHKSLRSVAARRAPSVGVGIARVALACAVGAALLAGCGQKGPLTLPKPAPIASPASAAASSPS